MKGKAPVEESKRPVEKRSSPDPAGQNIVKRMPVNDKVNAIDGVDSEGQSINTKNEGEDLFSLADYI